VHGVNNWATTLSSALGATDDHIHIPEQAGQAIQYQGFVTVDDEIIKIAGRPRATALQGTEAVNQILWTATNGGTAANGVTVEVLAPVANEPAAIVSATAEGVEIQPAGDSEGDCASTVREILLLVGTHPAASQIVAGASDFPDAEPATGTVTLAGGDDTQLVVLTRGAQGTVAAEHASGAAVEMRITAGHLQNLRETASVLNIETYLIGGLGEPEFESQSLGADQPAVRAWRFGTVTQQSVSGMIDLPLTFAGTPDFIIVLLGVAPTASAGGSARFTVRAKYMISPFPAENPWIDAGEVLVEASGAQYELCKGSVMVSLPQLIDDPTRLFAIDISRTPEHENDTLDADMSLTIVAIAEANATITGSGG
jgi:hypothetical protein